MGKQTDIPAWQALGLTQEHLDTIVASEMESVPHWWTDPPETTDDPTAWGCTNISRGFSAFNLVSMGYTGLPHPLDDRLALGRRIVQAGLHHFFGKWREKFKYYSLDYDLAKSRKDMNWLDLYLDALTAALALGDWASMERLIQWPGRDLRVDRGLFERTPEDNAFHLWLASRLRGEPEEAVADQRAMILRSECYRARKLLAAADALFAGEGPALAAGLEEYLRHFREHEIHPLNHNYWLSRDANILWHLARRRGLGEIPLSPESGMLIAKPWIEQNRVPARLLPKDVLPSFNSPGALAFVFDKDVLPGLTRPRNKKASSAPPVAAEAVGDMPPWRALGFSAKELDAFVKSAIDTLDDWWEGPKSTSGDDMESWTFVATMWGLTVCALGSLEYDRKHPLLDDWHAVGRRAVAAAVKYFCGSWRKKFVRLDTEYDRASSRAALPWISYYREGLTMAASLGDWKSVDRLLAWPGPDLKNDEGLDDRTTQDNLYQIWLAARLRGEPEKAVAQERSRIERGTRRRPKMLLAAADALFAHDPMGLSKALEKYLRHYRKNEFDTRQVDLAICADANVLWHLARRRKLEGVELPADLALFVVRK
jgi:hypothetical protein